MVLRTRGQRDRFTRGVERISPDRVMKVVGASAELDFQKALAIENALAGSRFTTPKALNCDSHAGRIEFEYVENARSLQEVAEQAYATGALEGLLEANRAAGELLAILHSRLTLPDFQHWPVPSFLASDAELSGRSVFADQEVFLHCDFSPVNVLVKNDGHIVLIDASPNTYFTEHANLMGPRFVDIATYTVKLHWPYRWRTFRLKWRQVIDRLRGEFLDSYAQSSGVVVDRTLLRAFERAAVRSFVNWKTRSPLIRLPAMAVSRWGLPAY